MAPRAYFSKFVLISQLLGFIQGQNGGLNWNFGIEEGTFRKIIRTPAELLGNALPVASLSLNHGDTDTSASSNSGSIQSSNSGSSRRGILNRVGGSSSPGNGPNQSVIVIVPSASDASLLQAVQAMTTANAVETNSAVPSTPNTNALRSSPQSGLSGIGDSISGLLPSWLLNYDADFQTRLFNFDGVGSVGINADEQTSPSSSSSSSALTGGQQSSSSPSLGSSNVGSSAPATFIIVPTQGTAGGTAGGTSPYSSGGANDYSMRGSSGGSSPDSGQFDTSALAVLATTTCESPTSTSNSTPSSTGKGSYQSGGDSTNATTTNANANADPSSDASVTTPDLAINFNQATSNSIPSSGNPALTYTSRNEKTLTFTPGSSNQALDQTVSSLLAQETAGQLQTIEGVDDNSYQTITLADLLAELGVAES